jgi:hypothetical protein
MREIRVRIKDGKTTVETEGFGGESCREATRRLEERLGKVTSDQDTDDIHRQSEDVNVAH